MARLSVNVNKIATLRNSRGGKNPDLLNVVQDCERFGAQGITVHPRPDERHITKVDVYQLAETVTTEFNIEGYPDDRYLQMIADVKPAQATLVPDAPDALTSNAGWDTVKNKDLLVSVIEKIKITGARVSIFVDPDPEMIEHAALAGADRIELFTEPYAKTFKQDREKSIKDYILAAEKAKDMGLGLNAGHDLNLENLKFFAEKIPNLDEVSIGHALICDALYYGLENVIQMYLRKLEV